MAIMWTSFVIVCLALRLVCCKPPNIVFMVADDLGWNDVGFHNPSMITPNIDRLAKEGVILDQSYVQPVCTPSRNAFLSGVYPFKAGLQHLVISPQQAACAPLNATFLPNKLQSLGYSTHAIGKKGTCFFTEIWLFPTPPSNFTCRQRNKIWECGILDSASGNVPRRIVDYYYNRTIMGGKDFRDGKEAVIPEPDTYSTYVYADRAKKIIDSHDKTKPMYLYLAFQSVHSPIQVPLVYENMYSNIKHQGRRQFSGMVTAMDDLIGNVTAALQQNGLLNDTLIVFTSDNGGLPQNYGNNYPLRGAKSTVYEGGTRASAFVWGNMLQSKNSVYDGMMHAVDWMPTIFEAAGGGQVQGIDGVSQWDNLLTGGPSKRTEFIYNMDDLAPEITGHRAIRVGDYKLIQGYPGMFPEWYPVPTIDKYYHIEEVGPKRNATELLELFNLKDDPNEHHNLVLRHPQIVKELIQKLDEYHKELVPANYPESDPDSNPANFNGFWTPGWC